MFHGPYTICRFPVYKPVTCSMTLHYLKSSSRFSQNHRPSCSLLGRYYFQPLNNPVYRLHVPRVEPRAGLHILR